MRIVAGIFGGRRLEVPKDRDIRPTSDKVRGAIFNALEARGVIQGARVLDCFCGTGALGLEALSRGAAFCRFWDIDKGSLALARANAQRLDVVGHCGFKLQDANRVKMTNGDEKYTLLFLDPPYRKDFIFPVLQGLSAKKYLEDGAYCILEMEKEHDPHLGGSFEVQFEKIYGETKVLFAVYANRA